MTKLHPLPQFQRADWQDLNGQWQFRFDDANEGTQQNWPEQGLPSPSTITVPFTYETKASGIGRPEPHEVIWYEKQLDISAPHMQQQVLLNFGGVDYQTDVFVNGKHVGRHIGGYTQFNFDITEQLVAGKNSLILRVEDHQDQEQPRGKQRWRRENFECWYVQTTGIWKSVWLEYTAPQRLTSLKVTPDLTRKVIEFVAETNIREAKPGDEVVATVLLAGKQISRMAGQVTSHNVRLTIPIEQDNEPFPWSVKAWSPERPTLYDLKVELYHNGNCVDEIKSYFGMREISIEGQQILLNGHELYQRLILDQNYWPDSGLTPKSIEEMRHDIELLKSMGYNGVRIHESVADPQFLYLADQMGLLIWSEMPSSFEYNDRNTNIFMKQWAEIIRQNYNHPAIITWVPFNESWGIPNVAHDKEQQDFTRAIYYLTKAYDPMRPVVTNDGWEHTISDILTLHDYEEDGDKFFARYHDFEKLTSGKYQPNNDRDAFAAGYHYQGQPIMITEFGGIAFQGENGWGYGDQVANEQSFLQRFAKIHQAIQDIPFIAGYCYTQFTDVSQEVNGLLTITREPKITPAKIKTINERRR